MEKFSSIFGDALNGGLAFFTAARKGDAPVALPTKPEKSIKDFLPWIVGGVVAVVVLVLVFKRK